MFLKKLLAQLNSVQDLTFPFITRWHLEVGLLKILLPEFSHLHLKVAFPSFIFWRNIYPVPALVQIPLGTGIFTLLNWRLGFPLNFPFVKHLTAYSHAGQAVFMADEVARFPSQLCPLLGVCPCESYLASLYLASSSGKSTLNKGWLLFF